jgi:hypothetical protein
LRNGGREQREAQREDPQRCAAPGHSESRSIIS